MIKFTPPSLSLISILCLTVLSLPGRGQAIGNDDAFPQRISESIAVLYDFDQCSDEDYANQTVGHFLDQLTELFQGLYPQARSPMRMLVGDALNILRSMGSGANLTLCRELEIAQQPLDELLDQLLDHQRSASDCFDNSQYVVMSALATALVVIRDTWQVVCDVSGCDGVPPLGAGSCAWLCAPPATIGVVALGLEHAMTLDDKCSADEHSRHMATLRDGANGSISTLGTVLVSTVIPNLLLLNTVALTQSTLDDFGMRLREGFGGQGRGNAVGGINNELARLADLIANGASHQQMVERQAVARLIEGQLAEGRGTASMGLPEELGGLLELVREIVANWLIQAEALGVDASAARALFREGDGAFNAGLYQNAFQAYRDSYGNLQQALKMTRSTQ